MKEMTEKQALNKIAAYCATTERCKADVEQKLRNWGIDNEASSRIIEQLKKENYLDDARYCRSFVHDKYLFDKWGKRKIAQALHFKQIPGSLIYKAFETEIDREEYLAILKKILEAKDKTIKATSEYERSAKLIRFALGRGFEMEDISIFVSL